MIENIYDGIQRPLEEIVKAAGASITRGIELPGLNREKKWSFTPTVKAGDKVVGGDVIGTVPETVSVLHKIMVPPRLRGEILSIQAGEYTVTEPVGILLDEKGAPRAEADADLAGACGPAL